MSNQGEQPTAAEAIVMLAEMQVATLKLIRTMGASVYRPVGESDEFASFDKNLGSAIGKMEFQLDQIAAALAEARNPSPPTAGDGGAE